MKVFIYCAHPHDKGFHLCALPQDEGVLILYARPRGKGSRLLWSSPR